MEDQAFSRRVIRLHVHPLPPSLVHKLSLCLILSLCRRSSLLKGGGAGVGEGAGGEPNYTTARSLGLSRRKGRLSSLNFPFKGTVWRDFSDSGFFSTHLHKASNFHCSAILIFFYSCTDSQHKVHTCAHWHCFFQILLALYFISWKMWPKMSFKGLHGLCRLTLRHTGNCSFVPRIREFPHPHWTKNPIYVFPEMKLRGLVPNSYIHVSVSDLYIPRITLPI